MLRAWTRILPIWLWVWSFRYWSKHTVSFVGDPKTYQCLRLDDEFVIVRMPTERYYSPDFRERRLKKKTRLQKQKDRIARKLRRVNHELTTIED